MKYLSIPNLDFVEIIIYVVWSILTCSVQISKKKPNIVELNTIGKKIGRLETKLKNFRKLLLVCNHYVQIILSCHCEDLIILDK